MPMTSFENALASGAAALLVADAAQVPAGASAVVVDDTRLALGRAWRRLAGQFSIPVIAVTGSNGKTTTKEMITAILGQPSATPSWPPEATSQRHRLP